MKRITRRASEPVLDSAEFKLETAHEGAKDALTLMRDKQRRERALQDYAASDDEITARHEVREVHNHTHVHMPSQPDHDDEPKLEIGAVKVTGLPKLAIAAVGIVIAAITAAVSHFAAK